MCCSEESTCDIVWAFRRPGNSAPLAPTRHAPNDPYVKEYFLAAVPEQGYHTDRYQIYGNRSRTWLLKPAS